MLKTATTVSEGYWLYKQIMRLGSWDPALAPVLFGTFRHSEAELMEEISIFFTFDTLGRKALFLGNNNIDLDSFKQSWMWIFSLTTNNYVRKAEEVSSFDDCMMCFPYDLPKTAASCGLVLFPSLEWQTKQIWTCKILETPRKKIKKKEKTCKAPLLFQCKR